MPRTTAPSVDLTGLVGWWRFRNSDFGTSTLTNEIPGGPSFTLTAPSWNFIDGANALFFAGAGTATSYGDITVAAGDPLDLSGATSMTRIVKVKSLGSGGNGNGRVISGPWGDIIVRTNDVNNSLTTAAGGGFINFSYTTIYNTGKPAIIAETYNGSDGIRRLIQNGVEVATASGASAALNSSLTGKIKLGAQRTSTENASQFHGYVYEIAIFKNRQLTAQETVDLFKMRKRVL